MDKTHVERLKILGEKIINTGGYCGSSTYKTLCEKVGLMMIQPVTTELQKYKGQVTSFVKKSINKPIEEKKKNVIEELSKLNLPKDFENNITKSITDVNVSKIFDEINSLTQDQYEALYILYKIIIMLQGNIIINKKSTTGDTFFLNEIIKLLIIIINPNINDQYKLGDVQYGGGCDDWCAIGFWGTLGSAIATGFTLGAAFPALIVFGTIFILACTDCK
jgi:hypothetical protein